MRGALRQQLIEVRRDEMEDADWVVRYQQWQGIYIDRQRLRMDSVVVWSWRP
jgi:hypothetical protein